MALGAHPPQRPGKVVDAAAGAAAEAVERPVVVEMQARPLVGVKRALTLPARFGSRPLSASTYSAAGIARSPRSTGSALTPRSASLAARLGAGPGGASSPSNSSGSS